MTRLRKTFISVLRLLCWPPDYSSMIIYYMYARNGCLPAISSDTRFFPFLMKISACCDNNTSFLPAAYLSGTWYPIDAFIQLKKENQTRLNWSSLEMVFERHLPILRYSHTVFSKQKADWSFCLNKFFCLPSRESHGFGDPWIRGSRLTIIHNFVVPHCICEAWL